MFSQPIGNVSNIHEELNKIFEEIRFKALPKCGQPTTNYHIAAINAKYADADGFGLREIVAYLFAEKLKQRKESVRTLAYAFIAAIKMSMGPLADIDLRIKFILENTFKPFTKIRVANRKKPPLAPEEVRKIINEAGPRTALLCEFLFFSAMRVTEACEIRADEPKLKRGEYVIYVPDSKTGDTKSPVVTVDLIERIRKVFRGRRYLFETANHKQYSRQMVSELIRGATKRILGHAAGPHRLRHSFADGATQYRPDLISGIIKHGGWKNAQEFINTYNYRELRASDIAALLDEPAKKQEGEG